MKVQSVLVKIECSSSECDSDALPEPPPFPFSEVY